MDLNTEGTAGLVPAAGHPRVTEAGHAVVLGQLFEDPFSQEILGGHLRNVSQLICPGGRRWGPRLGIAQRGNHYGVLRIGRSLKVKP